MRADLSSSSGEEKTGNKIQVVRNDTAMFDNFRLTLQEFRKNKVYCFLFFVYFWLEVGIAFKFVEFCAIIKRSKDVESPGMYPSDCAKFAQATC